MVVKLRVAMGDEACGLFENSGDPDVYSALKEHPDYNELEFATEGERDAFIRGAEMMSGNDHLAFETEEQAMFANLESVPRYISTEAFNMLAEREAAVLGVMTVNDCATGGFKLDNEFFVSGRGVCFAYPVNPSFISTEQ